MRTTSLIAMTLIALGYAIPTPVHAGTLHFDRTAFLADPGVTTTTGINFDGLSLGADLTDQSIDGVTFGAPGTGPILVIDAGVGIRNPLSASTGSNVLSPGGSDTTIQNDDLSLMFATPVRAAGLDVVFDAPDGLSFVSVTFFDLVGNVLATNNFIPSPVGAPGYQFAGFVSDLANIKRVVFDEYDDSPGDDHVAYDSMIFSPASTLAVPEPSTGLLLGLGLLGVHVRNRRRVALAARLKSRQ